MKYALCCVIVVMALIPAHAQQASGTAQPPAAGNTACILGQKSDSGSLPPSADMEGDQAKPAELLVGYALSVDGLLSALGDQMQTVSANGEAGELTQLEAVVLKLELMRAMIARLQTVSAVYDSLIFSDVGSDATPGQEPADSTPPPAPLHTKRTITVQELKQENAQ